MCLEGLREKTSSRTVGTVRGHQPAMNDAVRIEEHACYIRVLSLVVNGRSTTPPRITQATCLATGEASEHYVKTNLDFSERFLQAALVTYFLTFLACFWSSFTSFPSTVYVLLNLLDLLFGLLLGLYFKNRIAIFGSGSYRCPNFRNCHTAGMITTIRQIYPRLTASHRLQGRTVIRYSSRTCKEAI